MIKNYTVFLGMKSHDRELAYGLQGPILDPSIGKKQQQKPAMA